MTRKKNIVCYMSVRLLAKTSSNQSHHTEEEEKREKGGGRGKGLEKTYEDVENRRGDVGQASLAVLLDEAKTLGLLASHDERNRVGGVGSVRVASLGVEHLLSYDQRATSHGVRANRQVSKKGRRTEKKKKRKRRHHR